MEKNHTIWNTVFDTTKFLYHIIKATEAHDGEELLKAVYNASKNWDGFEYGLGKVSEYFHTHKQPITKHSNDFFTGVWIASDSKKEDYINQHGNHLVYSTPSADGYGYSIYTGQLTSNRTFVVVGSNSRGEKLAITGHTNNNLTEITCTYFVVNSSHNGLKSGTYCLDRHH
jgi:hypothetical protein